MIRVDWDFVGTMLVVLVVVTACAIILVAGIHTVVNYYAEDSMEVKYQPAMRMDDGTQIGYVEIPGRATCVYMVGIRQDLALSCVR